MSKTEILIIVLIVTVSVLFWYSKELQTTFENATDTVETYIEQHEILGIGAFVGLAALSAMLSPFSSIPLVPFAVVIWGKGLTLLFLLSGWLLGGTLTYLIGRYAIIGLMGHLIPFKKIEHYQAQIPEKSEFWLVLLFRLAMPAEIPGYVLGGIKYNFKRYFLATAVAETPVGLVTVFAGHAFVRGAPLEVAAWVVGATALVALMFFIFRKKTSRPLR